jgi:outer membrane lipoprotein-sorting protein
MRTLKIAAAAAMAAFLASACGGDGAFEETGEDLDEAVEDLEDAVDNPES